MGTQSGFNASLKPVEGIAPNWTRIMAPASGQIHKVDLPQRNGKTRSVAIEVESNTRNFRIRARDNSRPRPVVARGLNLRCPADVYDKEGALNFLKQYPEKFVLFEGIVEEMKDGYWMGELTQDHVKRQTVNKIYPYGTMGHALRWYLSEDIGSENQKRLYQKEAFKLMAMRPEGHEVFGHIPAEDLNDEIMGLMTKEWVGDGKSWTTLRGAYALISRSLSVAAAYPRPTGVRRGEYWGTKDREGRGNPVNNERKRVDRVIAENRFNDDTCRPKPFTIDECTRLIKAFKTVDCLKPYYPLFALLLSTGARPNEVLALKWTHILGLWEGHQVGTEVPPAKKFVLGGRPVFFEFAVHQRMRTHIDPVKRFKNIKNGCLHQPELNRFIPGFENLFEEAIQACLPSRNVRKCLSNDEFRRRLVFQGPGKGARSDVSWRDGKVFEESVDYQLPFDWHNFRRYFMVACEFANVPYRRPYNLRHTYVTHMCTLGEYGGRQVASWIGDTEKTMRARYLGYVNIPMNDKVEGGLDMAKAIESMSPAEAAQFMAMLANKMASGG